MSAIVTIIQARMGSSRLPGKVLKPLGGKPALWRVVERVRQSSLYGKIVIATSTLPDDDGLADWCKAHDLPCFRGSEADVLARYACCAETFDAEIVVRVTADCPLLDPVLFDKTVETHIAQNADYVWMENLPRGIPAETLSRYALQESNTHAVRPEEREHVIYYALHRPETFRVVLVDAPDGLALPDWRLTLDTPQDYTLLSRLFERTDNAVMCMKTAEIVALIRRSPDMLALATGGIG